MRETEDAIRRAGAMSVKDVAFHFMITHGAAFRMIRRLKHRKRVHISGWIRAERQGRMYPQYSIGNLRDVDQPGRISDLVKAPGKAISDFCVARGAGSVPILRLSSLAERCGVWAGLLNPADRFSAK